MKLTSPLLFVSILLAYVTAVGQSSSNEETQTPAKDSITNRIDSLAVFIGDEFYKKNYDKTIEFGELALELATKHKYYDNYAVSASFLGNAYLEVDDSLRAKQIFQESISLAKKQNDTLSLIISEIDFANLYALRDDKTSKLKAIELYKEVLPLAKKAGKKNNVLSLNSNISELSLDLGNIDQAEIYINASNVYLDDPEVFEGYKGSVALNRARLLTQQGKYENALPFFDKSLVIFENMTYLDGIIDVYQYSIDNALGRNNYREAFEAQKKLDVLELKKYETDKIEAIETVTTKFKLDEIKTELQEQKLLTKLKEEKAKRDTTLFWVKIAAFILIVFFGFIFYSFLKRKKLLANLIIKNKQYLEAKERSEHLFKAKSQLFSNITHELRTPMYGIIGISNSLLENEKFKEEKQDLKSLKFSADYLLALVNNILQFNKLESNKHEPLQLSYFDIRTVVYTVVETSKFLSEDHPNSYKTTIDNSIPNILQGDKLKLSQVLINLIGNASKFTNDGLIKINLQETARSSSNITILFTIVDNGVGIDDNKMDSLFDHYSQSESRQNFMGTGLGLPIVKQLLDEQHSTLHITSKKRVGTEVSFELTFGLEASSNPKKTKNKSNPENILKDYTILVVDDNKINQLVTEKFIKRFGAKCKVANSGQEAIEITKEETIDLILMDINMPHMNGFEATKRIRTFNEKIPIIALTAVDKDKVVGEHSFNLMNDIIVKPYSNETFLATLHKNLELNSD